MYTFKGIGHENSAYESNGDIDVETITPSNTSQVKERVKETPERQGWSGGLEFLMSCIAMSVGLGNIWRFPFSAYENGGGAFLIPYIIVLTVVGRPVYYLEMCLGQFTSRGNVKMFEALAPALKGIGYGQLLGTICVATYYCSLIALTFFYLVNSFTADLPWSTCRDEWEEENRRLNLTCVPSTSSQSVSDNSISSSELYFRREVLKEKLQIYDGIGYPEWRLTLCLLFSWFVTFLVTMKGVQSSGKASYFLAIFPYVIMITLLIRSVTLEGAADGMFYFIKPDWSKLTDAKVWYSAVTQCFFSLNVGFGTVTMYASYNSFTHNIYRDALIVTTLDTFTSLLSGTTIFGILGHLAFKLNVNVTEVINSGGTGLAFISYPEAIAKFDLVPWLFAVLFFFMLFILGIGSLVSQQSAAFTILMETFPNATRWHLSLGVVVGGFLLGLIYVTPLFAVLFFVMLFVLGVGSLVALQGAAFTVIMDSIPNLRITYVSLTTAIIGFFIGLVYITPGGQFIFTLLDHFGGTMIFLILTIFETTMVFWWYGLENFCDDVEYMLKRKIGIYWRVSWGVITPIVLIFIFIYFLADMRRLTHEGRDYPDSALACGWLIVAFGVFQVILWWSYYLIHNRNIGFIEGLKRSVSHSSWGPASPARLEEWKATKKEKQIMRSQKNLTWFKRKLNVLIGTD